MPPLSFIRSLFASVILVFTSVGVSFGDQVSAPMCELTQEEITSFGCPSCGPLHSGVFAAMTPAELARGDYINEQSRTVTARYDIIIKAGYILAKTTAVNAAVAFVSRVVKGAVASFIVEQIVSHLVEGVVKAVASSFLTVKDIDFYRERSLAMRIEISGNLQELLTSLSILLAIPGLSEKESKSLRDIGKIITDIDQLLGTFAVDLEKLADITGQAGDKRLEFERLNRLLCEAVVDFRMCRNSCSDDNVSSVEVAPSHLSLRIGDRSTMSCSPLNKEGQLIPFHSCIWTPANRSIVETYITNTIDIRDVFVGGLREGQTTITASDFLSHRTGIGTITVTPGDPPDGDDNSSGGGGNGGGTSGGGSSNWQWVPSGGGGRGAWHWRDCSRAPPARGGKPPRGCWHWSPAEGLCGGWVFDNACGQPTNFTPRVKFKAKAVGSKDPNEKIGPAGFGPFHHIGKEKEFQYAIFFENKEDATAPAAEVVVSDKLDDERLDLDSVSLGKIVLGDRVVDIPPGLSQYYTTVDLRPKKNLKVNIAVNLDKAAKILTWKMTSIDPETGLPPEDPLAGFLPPNKISPEGEGQVIFSIMPKSTLPENAQIANWAQILFDGNPLDTPTWINTIDNSLPTSKVEPLPVSQSASAFLVKWNGTDEGSGIKDYSVFYSDNGLPFTAWLTNTTDREALFTGQDGHTYSFYTIARDNLLRSEPAKNSGEVSTLVSLGTDIELTGTSTLQGDTKGATLTYLLTLKNSGPGKANSPKVLLSLPNGTRLRSCLTSKGVCSGTELSPFVQISTLNRGEETSVTLVASISEWPLKGGTLSAVGTVESSSEESNSANNLVYINSILPPPSAPKLKLILKRDTLILTVTNNGMGCFSPRVLANAKKLSATSALSSGTTALASFNGLTSGVSKLTKLPTVKSKKSKVYFATDCGAGTLPSIVTFDLAKIKGKSAVKDSAQFIKKIKGKVRFS